MIIANVRKQEEITILQKINEKQAILKELIRRNKDEDLDKYLKTEKEICDLLDEVARIHKTERYTINSPSERRSVDRTANRNGGKESK